MSSAAEPNGEVRSLRARAIGATVGFAIGMALLVAAAWVLYRQRGEMEQAWHSVRYASPWLLALAVLLPLLNWALISLSFWILMRRHGTIGAVEMGAAIGGAWLLNYLPLRAGMIGRVAYHKTVNGIGVRDCVRVMVTGLALGGVSVGLLLLIVAALASFESWWLWGGVLASPLLLAAGTWGVTLRGRPDRAPQNANARPRDGLNAYAAVLAIRYLDLLVWTARYAVVFALVGAPIGLPGAVAFAAVCQVALVVPFIGNGLGVREWAIGLTAAALPAGVLGSDMGAGVGLLADLVNRAAEVLVVIPVGIASVALLSRRMRRSGAVDRVRQVVAEMRK